MRLMIAALTLFIAACAPTTEPQPGASPGQTAEQACAARGGGLEPVGRMRSIQCVVRHADAGKRCTDGDDCAGDCLAEATPQPGTRVHGQCSLTSLPFGCLTRVEDGKAEPTLCVD